MNIEDIKKHHVTPRIPDIENISEYMGGLSLESRICDDDADAIISRMIDINDSISEKHATGTWAFISEHKQMDFAGLLAQKDMKELASMLANLFRSKLSFGLVSNGVYEDIENDKQALVLLLNGILSDISTCAELCEDLDPTLLSAPEIGNPYGYMLDEEVLVRPDACRHYYHADMIKRLVIDHNSKKPVVLEIGGGYGGMLIHLLRLCGNDFKFCYINCDITNTLLMFYYYISLYLEKYMNMTDVIYFSEDGHITEEMVNKYNIIIMHCSGHPNIDCDISVTYNSHSLSELSFEDVQNYMNTIQNNNSSYFFHENANFFPWEKSQFGHIEHPASTFPIDKNLYQKVYQAIAPWSTGGGRYREFLYKRVG